ncbi:hypothetical protein EI94DRAFT_1797401 [Lactarius quietus]|nr:hypothetical protein EI94DRAFT_1797401 [Lactarius quietus]
MTQRSSSKTKKSCPKATTTQLNPITSGEEFCLQDIEDCYDISNTSGPDSSFEFPDAKKENEKRQKICKICRQAHGIDRDKLPRNIPNYFYKKNTGTSNLRAHLVKQHPEEYKEAATAHSWKYKVMTQSDDASTHKNSCNLHNPDLPRCTRSKVRA